MVNFIHPSFSGAQHVYFITINGVAITQHRPNNPGKDGRMFNGRTDEKRGGGEEDVEGYEAKG